MAVAKVYNLDKKHVGEVDLPDKVYNSKVQASLVHQAIITQLAGRRRGTACTKTKSEVRGGGKKPFRQKGTGRARQGSSRSPILVGGGVSHGPKPRDYSKKFPKNMAKRALCSALSDRFSSSRILVVEDFPLKEAKTSFIANVLERKFGMLKALIIDETNELLQRSVRNLPKFKFLRTEGANVYDVMNYDWLVISKKAAVNLGNRLEKDREIKKETKAEEKSVKVAKDG